MRMVPLLNPLVVKPKVFLAPFVLPQEVYLLKARHYLAETKKTYLMEGRLLLQGLIKSRFLFSEQRSLYGSSTKLVKQVENVEDQLRKMGDDIFQGEVEEKIMSFIIRGVVEELVGWEKGMLTKEEALRGQLITF